MKKFERLPIESRKKEIKQAAIGLFLEKGFRNTTMENIISHVSLSKGGVYRIYPSTKAILADIILDGAELRNLYYKERAKELLSKGSSIGANEIAEMIFDSMTINHEVASLYVEFLIEKRRIPELEQLYQDICKETENSTISMIKQMGLSDMIALDEEKMSRLTELMNTVILGIVVLNEYDNFGKYKDIFVSNLISML